MRLFFKHDWNVLEHVPGTGEQDDCKAPVGSSPNAGQEPGRPPDADIGAAQVPD